MCPNPKWTPNAQLAHYLLTSNLESDWGSCALYMYSSRLQRDLQAVFELGSYNVSLTMLDVLATTRVFLIKFQ